MVALFAGSAAAAPVQYLIGVNTSSVSLGSPGFLDFQFNPGDASQRAVALVSNFNVVGGGGALGSAQVTGDVLGGPLPAPLTFTNDTAINEVFQQFTYGTSLSFLLSLSGEALSSPNGTATAGTIFGVGLYDENQNAILTTQVTGFAGSVTVNLDGTTTFTSFPPSEGVSSVVTFQLISVPETVPEPGSMWLLTFGTAGLIWLRKILR